MEDIEVVSIHQHKYKYVGEGNCNMVISLQNSGLILRLQKTCIENPELDPKTELAMLKNKFLFILKVMNPIMGETFVHVPRVVKLVESDLKQMEIDFKHIRPVHRLGKVLKCGYGMLLTDYTSPLLFGTQMSSTETLCVEIKCKQGWMAPFTVQYGKCLFCMNQYLKLKLGKIKNISKYCPLDLFSGEVDRMKKAVVGLISSPQNNFKMFVSGTEVYGEGASHGTLLKVLDSLLVGGLETKRELQAEEVFINVLLKSLLGPACSSAVEGFADHLLCSQQTNIQVCDTSKGDLPEGSVLKHILKCQMLDADVALDHHKEPSDYAYVDEILDIVQEQEVSSEEITTLLSPLHKYMIASTAKDCSIMLSFKRIICNRFTSVLQPDTVLIQEGGLSFLSKIGVVDLDAKPASKVEYHKQRDRDIVESFLSY